MPLDKRIRICLVEDNPGDARLVREMLRDHQRSQPNDTAYDLQHVESLDQAMDVLRATPPDVVLLDLSLPDSAGLDTLHATRAAAPNAPIVIMSGHDDEKTALSALQEGAQDYLVKGRADGHMLVRALRYAIERNRLEKRLRDSEQKFRRLVEQSQDGITLTDEQGAIIEWNPAQERITGLKAEEVVGKPLWDVQFSVTPEERQTAEAYQRLKSTLSDFFETGQAPWQDELLEREMAGPDGNRRFVQSNVFPIETDKGRMAGSICRDVTERKRTEASLYQREQEFRALVENAPDIIVQFDGQLYCTYVNPAITEVTGIPAEAFIGKPLHELDLPQHTIHLWGENVRRAFETGEEQVIGSHFRTADGLHYYQLRLVPERTKNGDTESILGITHDITTLVQREQELETLVTLATALRGTATQAEMLPIIMELIVSIFDLESAALATHHADTGKTTIDSVSGQWTSVQGYELSAGEGVTSQVISTQEPFVTTDLGSTSGFLHPELLDNTYAAACVPLNTNEHAVGALWTIREEAFSPSEIRLLTAIADMTATALQRAAWYEQTQHRAEQFATVSTLGHTLGQTLDIHAIYQQLAEAVDALLPDASTTLIARFDSDEELITCAYGLHEGEPIDTADLPPIPLEPEGWGTQSHVIRTRQPMIVDDLPARMQKTKTVIHKYTASESEASEPMPESALLVPMLARGEVIGVMQAQSYTPARFTDSDSELLSLVANTAAVAIANADLLNSTRRHVEQLQALRNIDTAITASTDEHVALSVILNQVTMQLGVDAVAVLIFDSHSQLLRHALDRGFRNSNLKHATLRLGEELAGRAALERNMVRVSDLAASKNTAYSSRLSDEGFVTYFGVPLVARGQVQGVLEVCHRSRLNPDAEWFNFLETLAGQTAIAIDNSKMFTNLQHSNLGLTLAYDTTLEGWAKALELRDRETEGHTRRVTEMTVRLARAMGIREEELVHVRRGALLHDIGKMGIPDRILLKPGPLDDDEWATMKQHPAYAYELLAPVEFLRPALDIPYCHHEKWDGSGYPRGLAGEDIPLAARLFAVVDVYDALCSDRPYRRAWPEAKALAHIREQAGQHFEPRVVEAFFGILRSGEELYV